MDDQIATLIINHIDSRIDDLKETQNKNFDLLVTGMRTMHEKFEAHEKDDAEQFTAIKVAVEASKAAQVAVASTKAKFWATVMSGVALAIAFLTAWWTRRG